MVQRKKLKIIPKDIDDYDELEAGQGTIALFVDYYKGPKREVLVLACPDCRKVHWCNNHTMTWNKQNNTITLEPSLICSGCQAHFWIKDSEIIPTV